MKKRFENDTKTMVVLQVHTEAVCCSLLPKPGSEIIQWKIIETIWGIKEGKWGAWGGEERQGQFHMKGELIQGDIGEKYRIDCYEGGQCKSAWLPPLPPIGKSGHLVSSKDKFCISYCLACWLQELYSLIWEVIFMGFSHTFILFWWDHSYTCLCV